ncbi:hypothetical protein C1646_770121 [Rhizophagus diaphanus]|nr:hypothetical protein C1646_770121 [Rhizophagus diaphanus] [Rhizophagus sp. MUCL 43196]
MYRKFLCKPAAKPQDPTPEIVQLQLQLEQLQELIPEVIPAPAEKTPNLPIDELAKWLAGPGDYNQYTPRRRAPQTDNEWFADIQGDYRGRWCDIQFVKIVHDSARLHKSLKYKTVWQADLKPNVRDIPYFPSIIADTYNNGTYKQVYHRGVMRVLLLKNDIDDHLTKLAVDIRDKIVKFMKGGFELQPSAYHSPHGLTNITKSDEGKYGQKNHFLWIKNPDALIYKDTSHKGKKYLCNWCFQSFPSSKSLTNHQEWCFGLGEAPQRVELLVKGKNDFEEFKNFNRTMYAPCVIIADFEADNRKCNENYGGNMHKIMEHKANSFCYMVHWIETDETWGPFLYRGPNATEEFVRRLDKELRRINHVLEVKVECIITEEAKKEFIEAVSCWICNGNFKFHGAAHSACNLKLQIEAWKTPIPVVFHNFRGYDSHLVCESVEQSVGAHQIKVISETFEYYKSMKGQTNPSQSDTSKTSY